MKPRSPARRGAAQTAVAFIAMVALAVLLGACSAHSSARGSRGPSAVGSTTSPSAPSAVTYSACMRSHGVANFPDPDSNGQLPKTDAQQLAVSTSQLQAAQQICRPLSPASGGSFRQQTQGCVESGDCPTALVRQMLDVQRKYAQCMRTHGVPNFPDPILDPQGRPFFDVSKAGMSRSYTRSAHFMSSDSECERLVGIDGNVPVDLG
jgi:hypothetical protein